MARRALDLDAEAFEIETRRDGATISISQALQEPVLKWMAQGDLIRAQFTSRSESFTLSP